MTVDATTLAYLRGMMHLTLAEVEAKAQRGTMPTLALECWLALWNATPGRFTYAEYRDGAMRQRDARDDAEHARAAALAAEIRDAMKEAR